MYASTSTVLGGKVPFPATERRIVAMFQYYTPAIKQLVWQWILSVDHTERPTIEEMFKIELKYYLNE